MGVARPEDLLLRLLPGRRSVSSRRSPALVALGECEAERSFEGAVGVAARPAHKVDGRAPGRRGRAERRFVRRVVVDQLLQPCLDGGLVRLTLAK